jgi:hypothetical protein
MPVRTFWFMAGAIVRLLAEKDIRLVQVFNSAQGEESANELMKRLTVEFEGERRPTNSMNTERDSEGFEELRRMAG